MKIEIDTHSHTLASGHAYNTIREMAQTAAEIGLKRPCDHGACAGDAGEHPSLLFSEPADGAAADVRGGTSVWCTELNILDEEGNVWICRIPTIDTLDIAIASLHSPCYRGERTKEAVLGAYRNVMLRENIDIIGHPDDGRVPVDSEELVKLAVETGTLLEVNNASSDARRLPEGHQGK